MDDIPGTPSEGSERRGSDDSTEEMRAIHEDGSLPGTRSSSIDLALYKRMKAVDKKGPWVAKVVLETKSLITKTGDKVSWLH